MLKLLQVPKKLRGLHAANALLAEWMRGRWTAWIGPVCLLAVVVYFARSTNVVADAATFYRFAGSTLLAATIAAVVTVVAALEWRIILNSAHLPLRRYSLYATAAVTAFWQNAANHWIGLAVVMRRLMVREGVPTASALRLITVDQAAELAARILFTIAVIALTAMPGAPWKVAISGVVGVAVAYFLLRIVAGRKVRRWVRPIRPLRAVLLFTVPFVRTLTGPTMPVCIGLAIFKKLIKGLAIYVLQIGLDCECPAATAWQSVVALDWATAVPLVPGHFGIFQAAIAALYGSLGYSVEQGLLLGTCYHLAHLTATLLPGAAVIFIELAPFRRNGPVLDRFTASEAKSSSVSQALVPHPDSFRRQFEL